MKNINQLRKEIEHLKKVQIDSFLQARADEIELLEAKLQQLQEVCKEIEKYCDNLIDTKGEKGKITLFQFRGELLNKFKGDEK